MRYPENKRYRDYLVSPFTRNYVTALRSVSLSVERGECAGFLGPNGAGKTTLLKLIGGLLYPAEGALTVDGHDTVEENAAVRRKVGFVLNDERSFYWRLTGIQNLDFFAALNDIPPRARRERIDELLRLVGLQEAGSTRVANYSCGMRQRLSIARGLLDDPDVLILDEPTRSLDPAGAMALRRLVAEEIGLGDGKTLLMATHQVDEAEMLCDRVFLVAAGRVAASAEVDEIRERCGGIARFYSEAFPDARGEN